MVAEFGKRKTKTEKMTWKMQTKLIQNDEKKGTGSTYFINIRLNNWRQRNYHSFEIQIEFILMEVGQI